MVFDTIAIIFSIDPEEIYGDKLISSLSLWLYIIALSEIK